MINSTYKRLARATRQTLVLMLTICLSIAENQAQTYKSPFTGVYTTVNLAPAIPGIKSKKTFMKLQIIENFNFQLFGRLDIYKNKKGQELIKTIYLVDKPAINYKGGHSVRQHNFTGYETETDGQLKKRGFSLGKGFINEIEGGIELKMLGFNGVFQKESADVSEILPVYESYLSAMIERFKEGQIITVKKYNYRDGLFALRMKLSETENPLTREELNIFYIANIRGIRSMHSKYNSVDEYNRSKRVVMGYVENALSTDWMPFKDRIGEDLKHLFFYYPSLKKVNLLHHDSPDVQLVYNVEKTQGTFRSLEVTLESEPIEALVQQRFRENEEWWQNERKTFLARVNDPDFYERGRGKSKAYLENEAKNRQNAIDGGYAYKSIDYWIFKSPTFLLGKGNGYAYSKKLKDIFDGNFGEQLVGWPVREMYNAFVVYLHELYPEFLPANAPEFSFSKTTTRSTENLYGMELSRNSYTTTTKVNAHPQLAEKYREYLYHESNSGDNIDKFGPISGNRYAELQHAVVYRFLSDFEPGTAAFEQLFRNFRRYTLGQPSLQQEGLKLSSQAVNQDALRSDPDEFLTQCMYDHGIENGDLDFCSCTHRKALKLAEDSPAEFKEKYAGNYYAFFFDYIRGGGCKK